MAKAHENSKNIGIDEIHAEFIKYAPKELHKEIATILDDTAETGQDLLELVTEILTLLQLGHENT